MNAHLARARNYIAIAESADAKREAYEKAADEIIAAQREDTTLSNVAIGKTLGRSDKWVRQLVQWRTTSGASPSLSPFARETSTSGNPDDSAARKVARERPDVIADAIRQAPPEAKREFVKAIADDEEIGSAAIEHEHLTRKFPDATPEQRRVKPRPGESVHDQVGKHLWNAKYALGRLGELVTDADAVLDDSTRAHAGEMLDQIQDMAAHLRDVLRGTEQFDRDLAEWLGA